MHIPKLLVVVFIGVLGAGSLHAQRPDSDLQAKARAQLEQALSGLGAQQPATATAAVPTAAVAAPPQEVKAPIQPTAKAPAATPAVVAQPASTPAREVAMAAAPDPAPPQRMADVPPTTGQNAEAQAKAEESMRKAMEELDAQQKTSAAAMPPAVAAKPAPAPKAVVAKPAKPATAPAVAVVPMTKPESQPIVAAAPAAKPEVSKPVEPAPMVASTPPANAKPEFPTNASMPMTTPMATPASQIPGSKEARLAELLQMYKSDKISPVEYHTQRAKILAEP